MNLDPQDTVFEGRYFRRFLPASKPTPIPIGKKWRTHSRYFIIFAAFIFVALASGHYVIHLPGNRPQAKVLSFDDAQKLGLMKEYELNPATPSLPLKEFFSSNQLANAKNTFGLLRSIRILLFRANNPTPQAEFAFQAWYDYLSKNGANFQVVPSLAQFSGDTLILPQIKSLSQSDQQTLRAWVKSGRGLLATGPVGVGDGKGTFAEKMFDVSFAPNVEAGTKFPTIFAADRAPWWDLPAGLVIDWQPLDDSYRATKISEGEVGSYESSYLGRVRHLEASENDDVVRSVFKTENDSRTVWLAVDPVSSEFKEAKLYADLAIASAVNWSAHRLQTHVATWPQGMPASVVLSVDAEDQFDGAFELSSLFQGLHLPGTFFIVSNELKKDSTLVTTPDASIEFASHTVDHKVLEGETLTNQFAEMQRARFDIESRAKVQVDGFHPPDERFDGNTLAAASENHVKYFFGDQRLTRLTPTEVADGHMLYFSRTVLDDFNLIKFHPLDDALSLHKTLEREWRRVNQLGGGAFFSFHSQVFGQPPLSTWVGDFLKAHRNDPVWFANFRQMTGWWHDREAIAISSGVGKDGRMQTQIKNTSSHDLQNVAVILDRETARLTPPEGAEMVALGSAAKILFPVLKAGEVQLISDNRMEARVPAATPPPVAKATSPKAKPKSSKSPKKTKAKAKAKKKKSIPS